MSPVHLTIPTRRVQSPALASPFMLVYVFAGLISLGTLLLFLPFTHNEKTVVQQVQDPAHEISLADATEVKSTARISDTIGRGFTPIVDALFTAASAATVTGLITRDTPTYWTRYGQGIILALMFVGGLGFMTVATFGLVLIGQRVTIPQRMLVKDSLQIDQLGGLARLSRRIVMVAAGIQLAGFVALLVRFVVLYPPAEAVWQAAFQAVSGFNNAGFTVLPKGASLSEFEQDKVVLGITAVLILLGATGYGVMADMARARRFSLYALNTKLVLIVTGILIVLGALVFLLAEYDTPATAGSLPVVDRVVVSVFESISGRTAGFTTVDYGEVRDHTKFFFAGMMLVGGASASVAGGIKVNTLAVIVVAVLSTLKGMRRPSAFEREIPQVQVQRAIVIGATAVASVFVVALLLSFTSSGFPFIDLLFEAVSALGTVGLSAGVTDQLSRQGQVVLIASMFLGRIGPVTLALVMARSGEVDLYRYARERVTLG